MNIDIEDRASLLHYLKDQNLIDGNNTCRVEKLTGGVSNKTVLFTCEGGTQWVIKQSLDKLRVKEDWFSDRERIELEYKGMSWTSAALPAGSVPVPVFFDKQHYVLIMSAVPQPHENLRSLILAGQIDVSLFGRLGEMLGTIHSKGKDDREAATLFADRKFFKGLRLEPFYEFTASRLPQASEFLTKLIADTLEIQETVVHGDYSPKNILVRNGEPVLLDYEVIHYGDPAFDIGFFLCQMMSFANHVAAVRQEIAEASQEFWKHYTKNYPGSDEAMEQRSVRHTLGCLLARVKGRSPSGFLTSEEEQAQVQIVTEIIGQQVSGIPEMISLFIHKRNHLK